MREIIEKKVKSAKIIRSALIAISAAYIPFLLLVTKLQFMSDAMIALLALSPTVLFIAVTYSIYFHPIIKSEKLLSGKDHEYIVDDISLTSAPTLPRSKIYCGAQVIYSKKPCVIIPYAEIAWVYVSVKKVYGITVRKDVNVFCRDGAKFLLMAKTDEFQWLLEKYISRFSPDLIVGYGPQQKRMYKQIKKAYKQCEQNMC